MATTDQSPDDSRTQEENKNSASTSWRFTRRSFLGNLATAGIAASAGPLLHAGAPSADAPEAKATDQAVNALLQVATMTPGSPFEKADAKTLKFTNGKVHAQGQPANTGVPFVDILKSRKLAAIDGQAKSEASPESKQYSMHSFGAHFCEVAYDPGSRVCGSLAGSPSSTAAA